MEIIRPLFVLIAFCSLLFFTTYIFCLTCNSELRLAILQAFVVMGGLVWFVTELLSVFKAITFIGLIIFWGCVGIIVLLILRRALGGIVRKIVLNELNEIGKYLKSLPKGLLVVLLGMIFSMLILGLIAFVAAPNTWDSMTYHLSRVMHWEQNQSLAFYPTSISRQLHLGPLAEIIILNFQILAGNDRLANLIQFFAMIGCVIGASLIAKLLDGSIYAQVFAAVAVTTLPMGILQSTSTQNDYVVAFWLVCFVSFLLKQMQVQDNFRELSLLMGLSLGLAVLTKVTALLFGASFSFWFTYAFYKRFGMQIWKEIVILLVATLIIIAPHSFRNYRLYGNPLGPTVETESGEFKYTNDRYGFSVIASNILRNTAIHLALPFENFNGGLEKIIIQLHKFLSIDINDATTTWTDTKFHINYSTNENLAGNPFHLLLIVVSIFFMIRTRKDQLVIFSLCLITGFFLFSWLLKWQPWHSRLHLPLFILALPLTGLFVSNLLNQQRGNLVMFALLILSIPYFLQNPLRPLIGADNIFVKERVSQYFANRPEHFAAYNDQAQKIDNLACADIGFMADIDDYEYPIWAITKAYGKDIHLEHIFVDNLSGSLNTEFIPCAIVSTYPIKEQTIAYQNILFGKFNEKEQISLFVPLNP